MRSGRGREGQPCPQPDCSPCDGCNWMTAEVWVALLHCGPVCRHTFLPPAANTCFMWCNVMVRQCEECWQTEIRPGCVVCAAHCTVPGLAGQGSRTARPGHQSPPRSHLQPTVQCAVCSVQCAVCSVQCALDWCVLTGPGPPHCVSLLCSCAVVAARCAVRYCRSFVTLELRPGGLRCGAVELWSAAPPRAAPRHAETPAAHQHNYKNARS